MDEGMERMRGQVNDRENYNEARITLSQVLRDARIVDNSFSSRRSGSSQMQSLWSRLRADLNQLAGIYGLQRV